MLTVNDWYDFWAPANVQRAVDIAAYGHHNTLLIGPPGSGKSLFIEAVTQLAQPIRNFYLIRGDHVYTKREARKLTEDRGLRRYTWLMEWRPCPCGYYGSKYYPCTCTVRQIEKHQARLDPALMGMFDLTIRMESMKDPSRNHVMYAGMFEKKKKEAEFWTWAAGDLPWVTESEQLYNIALRKYANSVSLVQWKEVAETIARMDGSADVKVQHIAEAIQHGRLD